MSLWLLQMDDPNALHRYRPNTEQRTTANWRYITYVSPKIESMLFGIVG